MRYPIHSTFLFAVAEAAKGSAGPDAELASIMSQVGEVPRTQPKVPEKKEVKKPGDRQDLNDIEEEERKVDEKHEPEDKGKSTLAEALRKANEPKKPDPTPEEKATAEAKAKEVPKDTYDKDLPELDEKVANPKIGEKFKRLKTEAITKLREKDVALATLTSELEAAKKLTPTAGDPTQHPDFLAMQKALAEREAIIERLSLEESPAFKAAYTDKINLQAKKVVPILKMITDERARKTVAEGVDAILRLDPGEEGDQQFYQQLGDLVEQSGLNAVQQSRVIAELQTARDLINERQVKVAGHKEASKEFSSLEAAKRIELAKQAVSAVDAIRGQYQTGRAEEIGLFKKNEAVFQYTALTDPLLNKAKAEVQKVAQSGQLTPDLISFVHAGVELPFYITLADRYKGLIQQANNQKAELQKELDSLKKKDPSKGSKENGSRRETLNGHKPEDEEDPAKTKGSVLGAALRKAAAA